MGSPDTTA